MGFVSELWFLGHVSSRWPILASSLPSSVWRSAATPCCGFLQGRGSRVQEREAWRVWPWTCPVCWAHRPPGHGAGVLGQGRRSAPPAGAAPGRPSAPVPQDACCVHFFGTAGLLRSQALWKFSLSRILERHLWNAGCSFGACQPDPSHSLSPVLSLGLAS